MGRSGPILQSSSSDDFNAIDPSILVDAGGSVWLTYGSFWTGIYQQQIDPATGQIKSGSAPTIWRSALPVWPTIPSKARRWSMKTAITISSFPGTTAAKSNPAQSDYKIVVGRGTSPNGPFTDEDGVDMAAGGGTILLEGDSTWAGPGGQTAYIDATDGDLIVFHALSLLRTDWTFVCEVADVG